MGYSVTWIAVRGKDSGTVCRELGLHRTGEHSPYEKQPFSAATNYDGWYVVVGDAGETLDELADLSELSAGCEVLRFGVAEATGYSGIEGWSDGKPVWSVRTDLDTGELRVSGDLPPVSEPLREQLTSGVTDERALDLPIYVAEALIGYSYGMRFPSAERDAFEVLERSEIAAMLDVLTTRLTETLAAQGFTPTDSLGDDRLWFIADAPIPDIRLAIGARFDRIGRSGIQIDGYASILSTRVAEVLRDLPAEAALEEPTGEDRRSDEIDHLRFGELEDHTMVSRGQQLTYPAEIDVMLAWFRAWMTVPLSDLFAPTATPEAFLAAARKPNRHGRIPAARVRATTVWALLNGHADAAAALMPWYLRPYRRLGLRRFGFDPTDSHSRAQAFDQALRARFPAYAAQRD
ncbi:hypothetical protein [Nocardia sp. CDC160]|uniref:hypothetical protein n=1 Tax=Nocardia sp. CDC160 TaxID=3112166 RepID=UPI002DB63257|nr:hypothetical protein [Nocardia sp. CDC160]MEC3918251.1 hypothetical protein [Nocardia sp. CDC160]